MGIVHKSLQTVPTRTGKIDTISNIVMPVLISQPFPEVRFAAFDVICGLASYGKGIEEFLMPYPGFFEFITNRNTEYTKEGTPNNMIILYYESIHHHPILLLLIPIVCLACN